MILEILAQNLMGQRNGQSHQLDILRKIKFAPMFLVLASVPVFSFMMATGIGVILFVARFYPEVGIHTSFCMALAGIFILMSLVSLAIFFVVLDLILKTNSPTPETRSVEMIDIVKPFLIQFVEEHQMMKAKEDV